HLNNDDEQGSKVLLQKKDHIQPSELHDDYKMIEPWKYSLDDMGWILFGCLQHSVYLDKEKKRYPIVWRLLDFHFDLLSILIDVKKYSLIKYILFSKSKDADDVNNPEKEHILKILDCISSELEIGFKFFDCIAYKLEIDKLEIENQFSQDIKSVCDSLLYKKLLHIPQYKS
ncbi:13144_t:CDS:2, partial [Dentiscutata erythropus]